MIYLLQMNCMIRCLKEIVGVEVRGKDHSRVDARFCGCEERIRSISDALVMVKQTGYGIAAPSLPI